MVFALRDHLGGCGTFSSAALAPSVRVESSSKSIAYDLGWSVALAYHRPLLPVATFQVVEVVAVEDASFVAVVPYSLEPFALREDEG